MIAAMGRKGVGATAIRVLAVGIAVAVIGSGCAVRLDAPPPPVRTPAPATLARDDLAQGEATVLAAAGPASGQLASLEAALVPARLAALGGVAPPWPSATASPSPTALPSLATAVEQARDEAIALSATTDDANLALLGHSIALSHALTLWFAALPEGGLGAAERAFVTTGSQSFVPAANTAIAPDILSELALMHDRARYLDRVIAARTTGTARTDALARALIHEERATEILALPGVPDERDVVYDIPTASVRRAADREAAERLTESALGWRYAELLDGARPSEWSWLLNASFDAFAAAALTEGFPAAALPALPGIAITQS